MSPLPKLKPTDADEIIVGPKPGLATKHFVNALNADLERLGVRATVTLLDGPANDNASKLPLIDPSVWQDQPIPARQWYVPKLIPSRTVTLLSGDGGLGKSLLALQLSVASALSLPTIGVEPRPGKVLYVGAEDEADEFQRRIATILHSHGMQFADLESKFKLVPLAERDAVLASPDRQGQMVRTTLFHQLLTAIGEFKPYLVVLDTSADLFGGDEIKRVQVRQFVGMLRTIAIEHDCAVLLLSHPSMTGLQTGSGTSGSTAWNNSVRSRLYLDAPEPGRGERVDRDLRRLSQKKSNYGQVDDAVLLRWSDGVFVPDDGKTVAPGQALVDAEVRKKFIELLRKFNQQGRYVGAVPCSTFAPHVMVGEQDNGGFSKKEFTRAMTSLLDEKTVRVGDHGSPGRPRRHLVVSADNFGPA